MVWIYYKFARVEQNCGKRRLSQLFEDRRDESLRQFPEAPNGVDGVLKDPARVAGMLMRGCMELRESGRRGCWRKPV
jgi:hypothetical protein